MINPVNVSISSLLHFNKKEKQHDISEKANQLISSEINSLQNEQKRDKIDILNELFLLRFFLLIIQKNLKSPYIISKIIQVFALTFEKSNQTSQFKEDSKREELYRNVLTTIQDDNLKIEQIIENTIKKHKDLTNSQIQLLKYNINDSRKINKDLLDIFNKKYEDEKKIKLNSIIVVVLLIIILIVNFAFINFKTYSLIPSSEIYINSTNNTSIISSNYNTNQFINKTSNYSMSFYTYINEDCSFTNTIISYIQNTNNTKIHYNNTTEISNNTIQYNKENITILTEDSLKINNTNIICETIDERKCIKQEQIFFKNNEYNNNYKRIITLKEVNGTVNILTEGKANEKVNTLYMLNLFALVIGGFFQIRLPVIKRKQYKRFAFYLCLICLSLDCITIMYNTFVNTYQSINHRDTIGAIIVEMKFNKVLESMTTFSYLVINVVNLSFNYV